MFKKTLLASVILLSTSAAQAACYGTSSYKTCYDDKGNNYSVQRYGNTTSLNGSNARTGSTWSQTSRTYGSTTYHNGTASNGNSWNATQRNNGYGTHTYGTDSRGNSFNSYQRNSNPYSLYE